MRGARPAFALVLAVAACAGAGAALAGDGPQRVDGARYAFSASSRGERASGSGAFDRRTELGGSGSVRIERRGLRVEAKVRTWKLSILGEARTLVLRVEVRSSSDPVACPPGTKGVTTLTDDRADAAADGVRTAFAGRRCASLALAWGGAAGGGKARVAIEPLLRS